MPGLRLIRPADANETAQAWRVAVDSDGPTGLVLTRQGVPVLEGTAELAPEGLPRGAYVLVEEETGTPDVVLVGTGSEVQLCVAAARTLMRAGVSARVVSFPSWDLFEAQDDAYRDRCSRPGSLAVAIEAASPFGWERYVDDGDRDRPLRGIGTRIGRAREVRDNSRGARRAASDAFAAWLERVGSRTCIQGEPEPPA